MSKRLPEPFLQRLNRLDLNLLLGLVVLVEEANVSRAAVRLGLSQSAASRLLARVRDAFEDPILIARARTLVPSPRALELTDAARCCLIAMSKVLDTRPSSPRTLVRRFRIIADDYFEIALLPSVLRRLRAEAPGVDVRVLTRGPASYQRVELEEAELFVHMAPAVGAGWHTRPLFEEQMVMIAASHVPATLEEFARCGHVVIDWGEGTRTATDEHLARAGLERTIVATVTSFMALPGAVLAADAVAMIPLRMAELVLRSHPLACGPPPFEVKRGWVRLNWHDVQDHDPAHAWFRNFVCEVGTTLPLPDPRTLWRPHPP